jgi:membrane associated rhomboid family serine protease
LTEQQTPQAGVPTCYRHPGRETYIRCQRCDRPICPDCMRDAAVGFQCPSCVAEGAKSTRSGRTAYGGLRPTNASITSLAIIVVNAGVWLSIVLTGGRASDLIDLLAMRPNGGCAVAVGARPLDIPQEACPGLWLYAVDDGAWWQLVTNMFTHVEVWHIGFNMLALWFLGPQMELAIGRARFLALYLLSGLAASTLVLWASPEYQAVLGASGAIFGLMGALLVLALKVGGDVRGVLGWIAINFAITFLWQGISWQGHLGGFIGGVVIAGIIVYAPRQRRTLWQVAGLVAFGAVLAVAITLRLAQLS